MALTSLADSRSGQLGRQTLSCIKKSVEIFVEFNRIGF
jgi:hypothetical protein